LIKAQIGGKVKTKAEAIKFIKEFKSKWKHSKIFVSLPFRVILRTKFEGSLFLKNDKKDNSSLRSEWQCGFLQAVSHIGNYKSTYFLIIYN
jgi:CRISPR/Cas system-associated endonuclease/helicase Cas3